MHEEDQIPEGTEVAVQRAEPALTPTRLTDEHLVAVVQARHRFLNATRPLAIGCTLASQWNGFGKTVRPNIGACNQINRRFGISVKNTRFERVELSDEQGEYYMYTCFATMALPNGIDSIESVGTCTSRDKFLGTNQGKSTTRKHWEVAPDHIMKKARTNCIVNGTMTMLGLDGLTREDLKRYKVEGDVTEVKFGGGEQGSATPQAASQAPDTPAGTTKPDPNADMPAAPRKEIMDAFFAEIDKRAALGVPEDELFAKYLAFNEDGEYPDRTKIKRFKKNKAMNWLKRKTAEIVQNEVV